MLSAVLCRSRANADPRFKRLLTVHGSLVGQLTVHGADNGAVKLMAAMML